MSDTVEAATPAPPAPAGVTEFTPLYRGYFLALLAVTYAFNVLDRLIVAIVQEDLKAEFNLADWQLGAFTGFTFAIFYSLVGIPIARFADRGGKRVTIVAVAVSLWSAATVAIGLAQNYAQLLIARMFVAIGEAGGTPPSHSMIADLYPKEQRGRALAVFAMAPAVGALMGLAIGGAVADQFGWRWAFIAAGAPGLLIGVIVATTLREPTRGFADKLRDSSPQVSFARTFATLIRKPTFVHVMLGAALCSVASYALAGWMPSYFIRAHGMTKTEVGLQYGLLSAVAGMAGAYLGGWLGDRFGRGSYALVLAPAGVAAILCVPFYFVVLAQSDDKAALIALVLPVLLHSFWHGPVFAVAQSIAPLPMRASASAIILLATSLIGAGLGPLLLGAVSDLLGTVDPVSGLRRSIAIVVLFYLWGGTHLLVACRTVNKDLVEGA